MGELSAQPVRRYFRGDDLFTPFERAVGLPIGNLTSQHFANRFLSPIDHKAKERLHIRPYLRYMDDMLMFSDDRGLLTEQANVLENACARQRLALHTWEVMPTRQGVGFLGFRILPDHIRLRRSTVRRARRRIAGQAELARADRTQWPALTRSIQATFAHWKHASSWRLRTQMLDELGLLHGVPEAGTQIAEREKGEITEEN